MVEEWTTEECLRREKEIVGFYLSGNPLEKYMSDIEEFANVNLADIPKKRPGEIRIGGIIRNVNTRYDKKNRPWAIVELNGSPFPAPTSIPLEGCISIFTGS